MHLDYTISISDIIIAVLAAIPACMMVVLTILQYRINKRQEKHQHTTTSIDYCKQLMEFFDACEKDWTKKEIEAQKDIRDAFRKAFEEQKKGITIEVKKEIEKLIAEKNFLKIVVKICPFLRLTGMEFEIFLNRLNSFARQCGSQMEFLLKGLQNINFDSLNFHQVLLIQKRIFQSEPCFSFYYDSILHEIKDLENKDPFVDSWRENMKNKLSILSELARNVDDRVTFLSELYSDELSEAEKKNIKKKFAEKTWSTESLWR
jgi:hypothetical protein